MLGVIFAIIIASYGVASLGFLSYVLIQRRWLLSTAYRTTLGGLALHTLALGWLFARSGFPFILSNNDAYVLIAWAVVALFLALSRTYRFKTAGAFLLPTALVLMVLSLFGPGQYQFGSEAISDPWVVIHLGLAFLAFASFLVSFVIGIGFILVEGRIKAKDLGGLVRKLPPLEVLDSIHYKALGLGLLLLTASIIAGAVLNKNVLGVFISSDPKQLWILFTWFLYALFLELRNRIGWRGRRGIVLSVLGFVIVVLGFFGLPHTMGV